MKNLDHRKYLDHKIIDSITHHIQFYSEYEEIKIRTIDYLSTFSNELLIRRLTQSTIEFQNKTIPIIVMECRADLKSIKGFINYLVH